MNLLLRLFTERNREEALYFAGVADYLSIGTMLQAGFWRMSLFFVAAERSEAAMGSDRCLTSGTYQPPSGSANTVLTNAKHFPSSHWKTLVPPPMYALANSSAARPGFPSSNSLCPSRK
jgi:hypothetical protein